MSSPGRIFGIGSPSRTPQSPAPTEFTNSSSSSTTGVIARSWNSRAPTSATNFESSPVNADLRTHASEMLTADTAADSHQPEMSHQSTVRPNAKKGEAAEAAGFKPIESVPYEPVSWQAPSLLKRRGVVLLVTPPGACTFAMCAYFSAFLSGRAHTPFSCARYPGDVLLSTYTPDLDTSLRAYLPSTINSDKKIFVQQTSRRFNWRTPTLSLKGGLAADHKPDNVVAIIVDTGTFPKNVDDSIVESAYTALAQMADEANCLILLVVESTSRSSDPFERVPRSLRALRGTLLAVPTRSKALTSQPGDPGEFLLLRLAEAAAMALTVRFRLRSVIDSIETLRIEWGQVNCDDPRAVFRNAETADLTAAQRFAVQVAIGVIQRFGPTTSKALQAAGFGQGIAPTTMRDALTLAQVFGHLQKFRGPDGHWYWGFLGGPQISQWRYS